MSKHRKHRRPPTISDAFTQLLNLVGKARRRKRCPLCGDPDRDCKGKVTAACKWRDIR